MIPAFWAMPGSNQKVGSRKSWVLSIVGEIVKPESNECIGYDHFPRCWV